MTEYPISLPKRVEILLSFLLDGNAVTFEGRELVLVESQKRLTLASKAQVLQFKGVEPKVTTSTMIVAPFSLSRFLEMALSFTPGDLKRMQQVVEFAEFERREK